MGRLYVTCDSTSGKGCNVATGCSAPLVNLTAGKDAVVGGNTGILAPVDIDGKQILLHVQLVARRLSVALLSNPVGGVTD